RASSQQLKFTTSDSCDRIKDEFQFLQAQYHSLKLECDKLASEKSEMQRHYIMCVCVYVCVCFSLQAEIVKRLNGICAQVLPYLSQEHQQQVLGAIERAKQVTPPEMNSIIRVNKLCVCGCGSCGPCTGLYSRLLKSDVTYSQVWGPILGIRALLLTHPKCTHTAVNTHSSEQLGVRCLAQGHLSRGIEGGESTLHALPPPTIPAGLRLELTTLGLRVRLSNH
uniref:TLE family member 5, transcriptional modulator n=1 Tax=Cyprinus carpio TaxID=7962 RepID=A0A8C2BZY7_CYPCA